MSSVEIDRAAKMGAVKERKENDKSRKAFNASHKKHNKHEDNRHFKFGRKRLQSFTGNGKFFPPYKRRKKDGIIPPTKFLLGGNICDPLNLNSMQDEEINRAMNAVTPKSSPLPTPKHRKGAIEVIIPPNICDPLNLTNCNDDEEYEKQLISPTKKGSKKRNRKRKRASSSSGKDDANDSGEVKEKDKEKEPCAETEVEANLEKVPPPETTLKSPPRSPVPNVPKEPKPESPLKDKNKLRLKGLEEPKDKRLRKVEVKDKIVSPVIPQPGAWKPRPQHRPSQDKKRKPAQQLPKFREKDARFQYGNYNRYYGYRNPHHDVDTRLTVFAQRKELFVGKDVLDIGCNIGHITLSVAREFAAKSVTGIDIDRKLIGIARKNIKHYVNCMPSPASHDEGAEERDASFFPMSMPISYGPVDIPGFTKNKDHMGFPYNVTFVQGNYVLEDDALLSLEQPQFDTILCLSITKWIHLNFGDAGLKQAFKRMHAQLRPGGVLLLEAQGWSSYGKKKNLTERIYKNYQSIEFLPQKFTQYLLSAEVGFCKCEVLSIPPHPAKGFQRPIQLFTKAGTTPEHNSSSERATVSRESRQQREDALREYERELFPKEDKKERDLSEMSQRSSESLSQYEQLENVYAPSTTPCYDDTPGHTNESGAADATEATEMCYLDVTIEHSKSEQEPAEKGKSTEKIIARERRGHKRKHDRDAAKSKLEPAAVAATPSKIEKSRENVDARKRKGGGKNEKIEPQSKKIKEITAQNDAQVTPSDQTVANTPKGKIVQSGEGEKPESKEQKNKNFEKIEKQEDDIGSKNSTESNTKRSEFCSDNT